MDENLAPVTRRDFEEFAAQLREEMEGMVAAVAERAPAHGHDVLSDVLGQLRILKWGAGFALAAIMGGFGFLYQGQLELGNEIRELRREMRSEITALRQEMRSEIATLRQEMYRRIGELRGDVADLSERVVGVETGQRFVLRRLDEMAPRDRGMESDELSTEAPAAR